jgi:hypothetical protein
MVDNEVLHRIDSKSKKNIFERLVRVGFVATAVGLILTVGSLAGLFTNGNTFMIVFAYGPLFGGLAMIFAGLRAKSRKNSASAPKSAVLRGRQTGRKL